MGSIPRSINAVLDQPVEVRGDDDSDVSGRDQVRDGVGERLWGSYGRFAGGLESVRYRL